MFSRRILPSQVVKSPRRQKKELMNQMRKMQKIAKRQRNERTKDDAEGGFMDEFFVFRCQEESAPCMLPLFKFSIMF